MDNYLLNEIIDKEFTLYCEISQQSFYEAKSRLGISEFNKLYCEKHVAYQPTKYYRKEVQNNDIENYDTYILYKTLKEQRAMHNSINIIKGILIGFAALAIISLIIYMVSLSRLLSIFNMLV